MPRAAISVMLEDIDDLAVCVDCDEVFEELYSSLGWPRIEPGGDLMDP